MRFPAPFQVAAVLLLLPWWRALGQHAAVVEDHQQSRWQPQVFLRRGRSSARGLTAAGGSDSGVLPDFTIGEEPSRVNAEEVVFWYFTVEGTVSVSIVADLSQRLSNTMQRITGFDAVVHNITGTLASMNTLTMWQELIFELMVLPTPGAADSVRAALDKWLPHPGHPQSGKAFRQLFGWNAGEFGSGGSSDNLRMVAEQVEIQTRPVRRPLQIRSSQPLPVPVVGTRPPPPSVWTPPAPNFTNLDPSLSDPCTAHTAPCLCAVASGCAWTGGGWHGSCAAARAGQATGASCAACPAQPSCAVTSCAMVNDACQCAAVATGCSWIASSRRCQDQGSTGAPVPCSACPHQYSCHPPQLINIMPGRGGVFEWSPGLTNQPKVRASFDRKVAFCAAVTVNTPALVHLHCDLRQQAEGLPLTSLYLNGTVLTINIPYNPDRATSICSLEILEGLLCDADGVPFLGLRKDGYDFMLGEAVEPQLVTLDPPQDSAEALLPLTVTLVFDERVRLTGGAGGGGGTATLQPRDAAQPAVRLPLSAGNVRVEEKELKLSFGTLVDARTEYSLVFPAGAVADLSGNPFQGLALGTYFFRTSAGGATAAEVREPFAIPWAMVAGVAGGALIIGTICSCAALRCQRAREGRKVMAEEAGFSANKSKTGDNKVDEITNSASFSLCYTTFRERPDALQPAETGHPRSSVSGGKSSRSSLASSPGHTPVTGTPSLQEGKSLRSSVSTNTGQMMVKVPTEQTVQATPSTRSLPSATGRAKAQRSVTFAGMPSDRSLPAIQKATTTHLSPVSGLSSLPSDARDPRSSAAWKALTQNSGENLGRPASRTSMTQPPLTKAFTQNSGENFERSAGWSSVTQPPVTKAASEPLQRRASASGSRAHLGNQMVAAPSEHGKPHMNRSSRGRSVVQEVW